MDPQQQYWSRGPGPLNLIFANQFKWAPYKNIYMALYFKWTPNNSTVSGIGVARIFDWGGAQTLKNSAVFTEIESEFWAEIGNSNDFSAQNQVISKKKKVFTDIESGFSAEIGNSNDFSAQNQVISKKKKRSSPKLRVVFQPKSEIRTIFPPKIRWSPKKKKSLHQNWKWFFGRNR